MILIIIIQYKQYRVKTYPLKKPPIRILFHKYHQISKLQTMITPKVIAFVLFLLRFIFLVDEEEKQSSIHKDDIKGSGFGIAI